MGAIAPTAVAMPVYRPFHDGALPHLATGAPQAAATAAPAPTSESDDSDGGLTRGLSWSRPLDAIPTLITNVAEDLTGERDERIGRAGASVLLAGERLLRAGMRALGHGTGAVAAGSNLLRTVLPIAGMGYGAVQVWEGWKELQSHEDGPLSIIHSKRGRTGLMSMAASAMWFVPGVGGALAGAALRLGTAANEMDVFKSMDWQTVEVESSDPRAARIVHPFDPTPANPYDQVRPESPRAALQPQVTKPDILGSALIWAKDQFDA